MAKAKSQYRAKVAAATQEQRDAMRFERIKAHFDWTNDDWSNTWLPWVRAAAMYVESDDAELKQLMADFVKSGEAPSMLEGLSELKAHLGALVKLSDVALNRSFLVLEQLGYSPENPPPTSRAN